MWILYLAAVAVSLFGYQAHAQTSVYRCVTDGVVTYTDRPCASQAQPVAVENEYVSTYEPVPVTRQDGGKGARPAKRRASDADQTRDAANRKLETCAKLESQLDLIQSKLRAGYRAKEGIRLEERRRSLKARARSLRC